MIIYLDTSNLVKLYVLEKNSDQIMAHVNNSKVVATSIIAYAEARAAFARKFREKGLSESEYRKIIRALDNDWENYFVLNVSEETVKLAGNLCESHWLRGYDALHLASASILNKSVSGKIYFSCSDSKLNKAAQREKVGTVPT
jgi:predicted nucleic acid-binding protein